MCSFGFITCQDKKAYLPSSGRSACELDPASCLMLSGGIDNDAFRPLPLILHVCQVDFGLIDRKQLLPDHNTILRMHWKLSEHRTKIHQPNTEEPVMKRHLLALALIASAMPLQAANQEMLVASSESPGIDIPSNKMVSNNSHCLAAGTETSSGALRVAATCYGTVDLGPRFEPRYLDESYCQDGHALSGEALAVTRYLYISVRFDANGVGPGAMNDWPVVRYALRAGCNVEIVKGSLLDTLFF